ncbi:unnamed protein product [Gongylonema pulchrum]|uniref:SAM-dependent methyltransferase n=1 Tax=Gongylonema pulchrum TaxID=637853 RepID=A0A183DAV8_9BILA|nr:unnamed protein product [Gongylonema pulchrum]
MLDDLLQREYADRYRDYIESGLSAADAENAVAGGEVRAALRPQDKRAQTFVRFGKRAQTFVRFGK